MKTSECKREDCLAAGNCVHEGIMGFCEGEPLFTRVAMPRELTDEQADAAMRATAVHLYIKGSQLTVNREKMKARYRALVNHIEQNSDHKS